MVVVLLMQIGWELKDVCKQCNADYKFQQREDKCGFCIGTFPRNELQLRITNRVVSDLVLIRKLERCGYERNMTRSRRRFFLFLFCYFSSPLASAP